MPNNKTYNYNTGKPGKFPDLSGDGKITKKDILMGRGVIKSGGGPNKVGSKEKFTEGNFPEAHHMKMMGSPLYYGGGKPESNSLFGGGSYKATDTNKEVFSEEKEEKKEEGSKKSEGTKRLSAARSRRKEARKNLKADRLNRRADRMEARRK